ncbi:Nucleoside-diphosphate-sugar epimerase [Rubritalea squalenifaciens DSM 18772]|uniref:Nucleoside-diphosphate-sugar epimerase n=1 Tax=Rubritalea squalenifaciens DSM 18772 TaxID=1123071 RepID=A0A1M6QZF8_9BACT|nr:NAD-dependent epimerase/dehydratase family protein [Rubritalea squalenifaciens]SHK25612.1 Nucleoside-diphosphate-sugar epimerase [Rubritalea squalenifaciens DSM 18772]
MKILLTGVAGFIGARTAEMLLEQGHSVLGVDNLNDYYDVRVKEYRLGRLQELDGFVFHQIDIENRDALDALFKEHSFDAVMNLAARAGVRASIEDPYVYLATNTLGSLNLLDLMVKHGLKKYLMASTSSLYAGCDMPFVESMDVRRPLSPYAASKLGAEAMAYSYHHLHDLDVAIVRYFTVYGPAGRPDMSPFRFIEWIKRGEPITLYGTGEQTRDFTYIDDIASGTIAALQTQGYEIYNLGGGNEPISINQMIEQMETHLGKKALIDYQPMNSADMQDTSATIDKAKSNLGWEPVVCPMEGFKKTVLWHLSEESWLNKIQL